MAKNIEDIIVPEKRKSIRNIPIPEGRRKDDRFTGPSAVPMTPSVEEYRGPTITRSSVPPPPPPPSPSLPLRPSHDAFHVDLDEKKFSKIPRKGVWIGSGIAVVIFIFVTLSIFNGATLSYVPKSLAVSFTKENYIADKVGEGKLLYSIVKLSKEKGVEAPATGEAQVSRKASGSIVVYNDASTESQKLVENTRFQTPSGLVYRIQNAITIPGKKTVSGVSQPGSIEATVYADEPGDKYNIDLSDFTLPGLKGGPRFTTIYARSKTKMTGGFVGVEKVVSEADQTKIKSELKTALRDTLIAEAKAQVPEDFILFPTLSSVTFEDTPQTAAATKDNVMVNMRGSFYGVMFKKVDLANTLAIKKTTLRPGEMVDVVPFDALNLAFASSSSTDLLNSNEIVFSVDGQAMIVWRTDEVALKADLVGRNKRDIPAILKNYPTISSATATTRPFWKSTFPSSSLYITVKKILTK